MRTSLRTTSEITPYNGTLDDAWEGYNIRTAMREAPELTRAAMINLVKHVSDLVDVAQRLKTMAEYDLCVQYLLRSDFGGNYTLEDFRRICEGLIRNVNYNRLKVETFVKAWEAYDRDKTNHAHVRNERMRNQPDNSAENRANLTITKLGEYKRNLHRPDRVEWMKGAHRMTWEEQEQLRQRDRQRREQNNQNNEQ